MHQNSTFYLNVSDVLATTAAFVGTTVRQVSLWVSSHRYVEVGRTTPRLGSSTCLVLSWCVSLPWSTVGPFCCLLCRSPWRGSSLWRGWKRWRGLWLLEKYTITTTTAIARSKKPRYYIVCYNGQYTFIENNVYFCIVFVMVESCLKLTSPVLLLTQ